MPAYKLSNIQLKTSRLQAIIAVKKFFDLYDQPISVSVAKLDHVLRHGITVEYEFQVEKFSQLEAFTYDLEETLNEYERWEQRQNEKAELACIWYNNLPPEEQEFVNLLRGQMVPRA